MTPIAVAGAWASGARMGGRIPSIDSNLPLPLKDGEGEILSPLVFCAPQGGFLHNSKRDWYPALRKANIPDFRWHDTRHTAASRLVMAGVDLYTVKEILGHNTIAMTQRYAHLSPGH